MPSLLSCRGLPFAVFSLALAAGVLVAQDGPVLQRLRAAARLAPLVVAHRGASEQCPENTLAALRAELYALTACQGRSCP